MKKTLKAIAILIVFAAIGLSAAEVAFDSSFPDEIKSTIGKAIEKNAKGRGDIVFSVSDYTFDDSGYDGMIYTSFILGFGDKELKIEVLSASPRSQSDDIEREIKAALYYDESLFSDSSLKLEYIHRKNYSFSSDNHYRNGTSFHLVDTDGRIRGLFEVSNSFGNNYILRPYYMKNALPGIRLERSSSWRWNASFASDVFFRNFMVSLEVGNTSWIYPFVPKLSFDLYYKNGSLYYYGGLGLEASFSFASLFSTSFTLVEDGRIGASAFLLLGYGRGEFSYGGVFNVYYAHSPIAYLEWRLGYEMILTDTKPVHAIYLSLGGTF